MRAIVVLTGGLQNASSTTEENCSLSFGNSGIEVGLSMGWRMLTERILIVGGETFKGTISQ